MSPYTENEIPNRVEEPPAPITRDTTGDEEHFVDRILAHKRPPGRYFSGYRYLVAWSGFPLHSATWEPRVHLCDPRDNVPTAALAEYEQSHGFFGNPPAEPALHRKLLAQNQR